MQLGIRRVRPKPERVRMKSKPGIMHVWLVPVLLGLLSAVGLLAALLSSGPGDWISWCALAVPVAVSFWWSVKSSDGN